MTRAHDGGSAEDVERQAAEWIVRIDLHGTPENWAALDAWLAANPRHRASFLRLSVFWKRADRLKELAPYGGSVDPDLLAPESQEADSAEAEIEVEDAVPEQPALVTARVIPFDQHLPERREQAAAASAWADTRAYRAASITSIESLPANEETSRTSEAEFTQAAPTTSPRRFRTVLGSRLAASVAVATVVTGALVGWYAVDRSHVDVYSTQVGEFHRVTLDDGSVVALNTNSEVRVRYTAHERHVDLVRGEALFEVAKNKERPFDVEAGHATVRAVGTAFTVRLHDGTRDERVDVVVTEGRIAINPPSAATYPAGTVAIVRNGRVETTTTLSSEDISGKLGWISGRLVFQGEKLGEVVTELNRYNQRKLLVADPDISDLRIGGNFQATDPEGFARALNRTFGIKSHHETRAFGSDVIRLDSGVP